MVVTDDMHLFRCRAAARLNSHLLIADKAGKFEKVRLGVSAIHLPSQPILSWSTRFIS